MTSGPKPPSRNLTEKERYTNALLTISLEEDYALGEHEEGAQGEPMDMDEDGPDFYNSKMAIPDSVFDTDTDVKSIPGFVEGKLPPRIKAICKKYGSVFRTLLTADKHTKFKPATLPLIKEAKPSRRARTCRKTPLHGKRTMDKMLDALLGADMIEKVTEGTGEFLFEAFLVPKPKDSTGPPRLVVDYSPLKHCFDRYPFKQTDPFTILSTLKSGCKYHSDMKTGYW